MELNPQWVAGFVDGEGTFYIGINKNETMAVGYQVLPEFRIVQHQKDIRVLYALKDFFGAGVVRVNHDTRFELRIRSLDHLKKIIIPFFEKHELKTQKKFDYIKFKKIIALMEKGEHLNEIGLCKIIGISTKMNRQNKIKAEEILKLLKG
jgi:hypothetical protein